MRNALEQQMKDILLSMDKFVTEFQEWKSDLGMRTDHVISSIYFAKYQGCLLDEARRGYQAFNSNRLTILVSKLLLA